MPLHALQPLRWTLDGSARLARSVAGRTERAQRIAQALLFPDAKTGESHRRHGEASA